MTLKLKRSEKLLLALCAGIILMVGCGLLWKSWDTRKKAAIAKIADLEPKFTAAAAAAADAPFWKERNAWLDSAMPAVGDAGMSHSRFLEQLQTTARERGLQAVSPVLLKPEGNANFRDLSINLQVSGPDSALFRWLAEIQSPEKFQLIKYLLLSPASEQPPRMTANVTIARLFKP